MSNAHVILIAAIISAFIHPVWWVGLFQGAAIGLLACLVGDVVEAIIRAIAKGIRDRS